MKYEINPSYMIVEIIGEGKDDYMVSTFDSEGDAMFFFEAADKSSDGEIRAFQKNDEGEWDDCTELYLNTTYDR